MSNPLAALRAPLRVAPQNPNAWNSLIHWIVIYPVDSIVHPLNNRGLFQLRNQNGDDSAAKQPAV